MIIFVLKEGVDGQVVRRRCIPLFHMKSRYVRIAREMNLEKLSVGKNPPEEINVAIEIPAGAAPVKYELDKDSGALLVDRFLHTPMHYPVNYGFVPHTLSDDGDPIDACVLTPIQYPTGIPSPGLRCRQSDEFLQTSS